MIINDYKEENVNCKVNISKIIKHGNVFIMRWFIILIFYKTILKQMFLFMPVVFELMYFLQSNNLEIGRLKKITLLKRDKLPHCYLGKNTSATACVCVWSLWELKVYFLSKHLIMKRHLFWKRKERKGCSWYAVRFSFLEEELLHCSEKTTYKPK